jgi:hypothetical protein
LLLPLLLPATALREKDAGIMVETPWQDAVFRGLLAAAVSLTAQWLVPRVVGACRKFYAARARGTDRTSDSAARRRAGAAGED